MGLSLASLSCSIDHYFSFVPGIKPRNKMTNSFDDYNFVI